MSESHQATEVGSELTVVASLQVRPCHANRTSKEAYVTVSHFLGNLYSELRLRIQAAARWHPKAAAMLPETAWRRWIAVACDRLVFVFPPALL